MNPISKNFETADQLLRGVFERRNPLSIIFSGPPGVGKSFLLRKLCREFGHKWQPIRPSAKGLIEYLSENGRSRAPLIFDDFDDVFMDSALVQLFKIILDSNDKRVLSNQVRGGNYIAPFQVTSAAIFLTNKDFTNPRHFPRRVWDSDIPAFRDRSFIFALAFERESILDFTIDMAETVFRQVKQRDRKGFDRFLSREDKAELVAHLRENASRYYEVSPRTLARLGKLRLGTRDPAVWQAVRDAQLRPGSQAAPGGAANGTVGAAPGGAANELKKKSTLSQRLADARWHGLLAIFRPPN